MKKAGKKVVKFLSEDLNRAFVLFFILILVMFCGITLSVLLSLPDVDAIKSYSPPQTTTIYAIDGKELARLHQEENRITVPLSKISPYLIMCVIANEDERFYQHRGVDIVGIGRAAFSDLLTLSFSEGGSTITQQLARNIFLTHKKNVVRKLAEILLALDIEKKYTKQEILEMYLNQIYWGHNAYGIETAAKLYFGKSAAELDLAESALLAGLLGSPEYSSPYRNPQRAKKVQKMVLKKLVAQHRISRIQAETAQREQFEFPKERLKRFGKIGAYFISYVVQDLISRYGEESVYKDGYKVYTTLDARMQTAAEEAVEKFVKEEGEKYLFSQSALVAIDPRTGYIKAMVGGENFNESMFNRAVQAKRQPGSAFKPFVYTVAMEQGVSPGTVLKDEKISFDVPITPQNPTGKWEPKNFNSKWNGPVTVRKALEMSLNIPSIKLAEKVGVMNVIKLARDMGIQSPLEPSYALALGVSELTLLELTSAYGTFANNGLWVKPSAIIKIEDQKGHVIYENKIEERKVLDENIAAVMVDLMKGVLIRGTGVRGRLEREAAAKTGTTEDFRDAWFIGYVPQLVAGVWVGNDNNKSMKGVAEVSVCPRLWKMFMQTAIANEPAQGFLKPKGLVKMKVCLDSGLSPNEFCPPKRIIEEYFWAKNKPIRKCDVHKSDTPEQAIPMEQIEIEEEKP